MSIRAVVDHAPLIVLPCGETHHGAPTVAPKATVKFSLMNVGWAQLREHVCELERQLTNPRSPLMRGKATCLLIAAQEVTVRPTPPPPVDRDSEQIKDYTRELQVRR